MSVMPIKTNVVLLGPPGCGKGTQAFYLAERFSLYKLSTGDLIRKEIDSNSARGNQMKQIVNAGGFTSDDIILGLIREKIETLLSQEKGIIFDGVPRTLNQAKELDKILISKNSSLDSVIELKVTDNALIERILGRYTCAKCDEGYNDIYRNPQKEGVCDKCGSIEFKRRKDDTKEIIQNRLDVYRNETEPLLSYYDAKGILTSVDGLLPIEEVSQALEAILLKGAVKDKIFG